MRVDCFLPEEDHPKLALQEKDLLKKMTGSFAEDRSLL